MSFISLEFWVFFVLVIAAYWIIRKQFWQNIFLLLASYIFYGWVSPWLAFMLMASTLADYFLAQGIRSKPARTRLFISLSFLLNLGLLAFFKYYNFFSADLARLTGALGLQNDFFLVKVLLPIGLSFYTLKKLSYMIDVARGTLKATHTLIDFALYVAFFPQLVAGPIDRPQKLLPQIEAPRIWKSEYLYEAWPLLVMGLFKKIVVADTLRTIVDRVFGLSQPNLILVISATLAFAVEILADFSGYTDIARGLAWLLGFQTSENFKTPYISLSPTEFWNRWHITLSTWLRDYIFFPARRAIMRSRRKFPHWFIQAVPPLLTMTACGIWHGAEWNFVLWGLLHGIWIVLYQSLGLHGEWKPAGFLKTSLAWLGMFAFILFTWLLFRAPSIHWIFNVLSTNPLRATADDWAVSLITLTMMAFYCLPLLIKFLMDRHLNGNSFAHGFYYALATVAIILYISSSTPDFIYFQF